MHDYVEVTEFVKLTISGIDDILCLSEIRPDKIWRRGGVAHEEANGTRRADDSLVICKLDAKRVRKRFEKNESTIDRNSVFME